MVHMGSLIIRELYSVDRTATSEADVSARGPATVVLYPFTL